MDDGLIWLTLPACTDSLQPFMRFLHEGARVAFLPESEFGKLDLVLEEILVNIARYAYPQGETGSAEVGYAVPEPGRLLVQVRDSGRAFNPLECGPPDLTGNLLDRPIGGLGIFLVHSFTESLSYSYVDGHNSLSFTFRGDA